jgi:hypothetical protein
MSSHYCYFDRVVLKNRITWKAFPCKSLEDAIEQVQEADVIGVDEGQFVCSIMCFL